MSLYLDKTGWKRVAFGDVIRNITERVDDPQQAGVDRYVGLEHLDPGVLTVQRWDSPDKVAAQKLRFYPGDVIFGRRRAYQKKVAMAEFEGICSAHALVLRADPNFIQPDFLPVFLASDYFLDRAISISVGSLSPTVNWRDLKVQEFDLPPLDEQQRIANLLWALEGQRAALAALRTQIAGSEAALVATIESRAPKREPLGDLVETILDRRGITPTKLGGKFTPNGVPVVSAMNVVEGRLDLARQERFVPDQVAQRWMPGALHPGDIIMTSEAPLGSLVLISKTRRLCLGQRLFGLRPAKRMIVPEYLYAWLGSDSGQSALDARSSGTTVKGIRQAELVRVEVPLVPIEEQRRFVDTWRRIQASLATLNAQAEQLVALRAALFAEIFGGAE